MSQPLEIRVPDLGGAAGVKVIDVLVAVGDVVAVEQPLVTLESEKATMDVPSTAAGRVTAIHLAKDAEVAEGALVVTLEVDAAAPAPAAPAPAPVAAAPVAAPVAAAAPATPQTVVLPDLGGSTDVEVIEVMVAVGDVVAVDQPLATLESEKATMDVPSTAAGTVTAVHLEKGAKVNAGDAVITVAGTAVVPVPPGTEPTVSQHAPGTEPTVLQRVTGIEPTVIQRITPAQQRSMAQAAAPGATAVPVLPAAAAVARGPQAPATLPPINEAGFARAHASPSVRRFARELGVDLGQVRGTGQKGRVTQDDVKAWVKQVLSAGARPAAAPAPAGAALPRVPEVDFAKFGPVQVQPLSRIQRISGPRLHASWVNLPHVTQFDQADITDLEATRAALKDQAATAGVKLTPLAFIVRACARVIARFPKFASSLDAAGENLVLKQYLHIGFAADTPNGLVVPVIRDADRKDVYEIARSLADLSARARAGTLKAADMQGGCFTISSLGGIGGTAFTPIINAPEVAILGVSKSSQQPHWDGTQFVPRLTLPLSLSYDHRVIDGADAARFTTALAAELADVKGLLEAVP